MKYVSQYRDRHGRTRYRFRRAGADLSICSPDNPEFPSEYSACLTAAEKLYALRKQEPHAPLVTQARNYLMKQALSAGGFVYFVHGDTGRVKIGFTTDPVKRFGSLRTNCPDRLTLLGLLPGTKDDEREWHKRFEGDHLFGEWFRSTSELRREVRAAKTRTLVNIVEPVGGSN